MITLGQAGKRQRRARSLMWSLVMGLGPWSPGPITHDSCTLLLAWEAAPRGTGAPQQRGEAIGSTVAPAGLAAA